MDKKIIHFIIENYEIDGKNFSSLPQNIVCDIFSLDVKFICLSKNLINDIELCLNKYHVSIKQILSSDYIKSFNDKDNPDIFTTASRIVSGYNKNEVLLVKKVAKNKGIFEKFFDIFISSFLLIGS